MIAQFGKRGDIAPKFCSVLHYTLRFRHSLHYTLRFRHSFRMVLILLPLFSKKRRHAFSFAGVGERRMRREATSAYAYGWYDRKRPIRAASSIRAGARVYLARGYLYPPAEDNVAWCSALHINVPNMCLSSLTICHIVRPAL